MSDRQPNPPITDALRTELGAQATPVEQHLNEFYEWMVERKEPDTEQAALGWLCRELP